MIVTIDGPAGTGKSTIARLLAERLGFAMLDTGAMYRAVALACLERGLEITDATRCSSAATEIEIRFEGSRVLLNGRDCSEAIRQTPVTQAVPVIAAHPGVRAHMVHLQRAASKGVSLVTEGRDQGTIVFPDAPCKFFLTATPEERARRRQLELAAKGQQIDLATILAQQTDRDRQDETRACGPLIAAPDAILIDTTTVTIAALLPQMEATVRERAEVGN